MSTYTDYYAAFTQAFTTCNSEFETATMSGETEDFYSVVHIYAEDNERHELFEIFDINALAEIAPPPAYDTGERAETIRAALRAARTDTLAIMEEADRND